MDNKCPVCNLEVSEPQYYDDRGKGMHRYSCPRCGDYKIETGFERVLSAILNKDVKKIAALSHWIRTKHESIIKEPPDDNFFRKTIILEKELVESIIKHPPPNPSEQANNIIGWLGENLEAPGEVVKSESNVDQSIMGCLTPRNFVLVIKHLIDSGIVQGTVSTATANVTLTFQGWQYYEELKRGAIDSRRAFMAMKYGD